MQTNSKGGWNMWLTYAMCVFLGYPPTRRGSGLCFVCQKCWRRQQQLVFSCQGRNRIGNLCLLLWSRNQNAVLPLEEPIRYIADKARQIVSNLNILNAREPFIKQVETLLPQWSFRSVSRDRVGRKMTEPARTDCFTTTVGRCTLHSYCSNFLRLKIWPFPSILLTTLMLSLAISSCFQECNCSSRAYRVQHVPEIWKQSLADLHAAHGTQFFRKWQILWTITLVW